MKLNRIVTVTVTVTVTGVRVTVSVTLGGPNRTIGRHRRAPGPGPARGPLSFYEPDHDRNIGGRD